MLIDPVMVNKHYMGIFKGGDYDDIGQEVVSRYYWSQRIGSQFDSGRLTIPDSEPIQKENLHAN